MILVIFPFILPFITSRGFDEDINLIVAGDIGDYQTTSESATLSYRFAWVFERWIYMQERMLELLVGLGLYRSPSNAELAKYSFKIGLWSNEWQRTQQLITPDIAYGNLLTRLGLIGIFLYFNVLVYIGRFFYKHRYASTLIFGTFIAFCLEFVVGLSSTTISETSFLTIYYLIFVYILQIDNE